LEKKEFIQGIHYYLDGDRVVFTALFHFERGTCCGNKCRHCPYDENHTKGTKILKEEFAYMQKKF